MLGGVFFGMEVIAQIIFDTVDLFDIFSLLLMNDHVGTSGNISKATLHIM